MKKQFIVLGVMALSGLASVDAHALGCSEAIHWNTPSTVNNCDTMMQSYFFAVKSAKSTYTSKPDDATYASWENAYSRFKNAFNALKASKVAALYASKPYAASINLNLYKPQSVAQHKPSSGTSTVAAKKDATNSNSTSGESVDKHTGESLSEKNQSNTDKPGAAGTATAKVEEKKKSEAQIAYEKAKEKREKAEEKLKTLKKDHTDRIAELKEKHEKAVELNPTNEAALDKAYAEEKQKLNQEYRKGTTKTDANGKEVVDKQSKRAIKKEIRQDERQERREAKKVQDENERDSIIKENSGNFGGRYGGRSEEKTQTANTAVQGLTAMSEQQMAAAVARRSSAETAALQARGTNATNSEYAKTQAEQMNRGAKALGNQAMITTAAGLYQGYMGLQHLQSRKKVTAARDHAYDNEIAEQARLKTNAGNARDAAEDAAEAAQIDYENADFLAKKAASKLSAAENNAKTFNGLADEKERSLHLITDKTAKESAIVEINGLRKKAGDETAIANAAQVELDKQTALANLRKKEASNQTKIAKNQNAIHNDALSKETEYSNNAGDNAGREIDKQNKLAEMQAGVAIQTLGKAMALVKEKAAVKSASEILKMQAAAMNGGGFVFNPNPTNPNDPGVDPNDPNQNPGQVVTTDNTEQGIDPGADPFNPNMDGDGVIGPEAGAFVPGNPSAGGGASGGGIGAAGSTSAAKDDSKGEGVAPGKAQTGGQYAAGEGGSGSRFSRPGGGSGSADSSWLDMMKKFLPGSDDLAKEEKREDYSDRSIASDQPSVLGRNKNIFEEISKKYQKKNIEGAVVFSGDRS